jgi:uncharacterized membrane protein
MLLLKHFNQTRKSYPIETEVYYKSFTAPFSECFNQTFLDIRNRPHRTKPGGRRKLWFILFTPEFFDDPEYSARLRNNQLQQQKHSPTWPVTEKTH